MQVEPSSGPLNSVLLGDVYRKGHPVNDFSVSCQARDYEELRHKLADQRKSMNTRCEEGHQAVWHGLWVIMAVFSWLWGA